MPFNAYLYVKAEKGEVKGFTGENEKTADGKTVKDMSRVQAVNHSIRVPTQAQTGEPTGVSQHSPLMVTVEMDRSVAELYKAMSTNARLSEVKLYFFRSGAGVRGGGKTNELFHNWLSITLEDARIVGMDLRKSFTMEGSSIPDLIDISFSYYKIKWEDHDDKKEAEYSWDAKSV
jgi:type VI secretion system secreted protein Hcp